MYLDPTEKISGVPAVIVRDFLKRWQHSDWSVATIAAALKLQPRESGKLVRELLGRGFVELHGNLSKTYSNTVDGNQFANASAAKPLKRATAERKVAELLGRVSDVNSNPYYLYRVASVRVFGSYLTGSDHLNDIDLVIEVSSKEPDRNLAHGLDMQRIRESQRQGRHFSNIVDELFWPQHEVFLYLRNRSRSYSFHSPTDGVLDRVDVQTLFELDE